MEKIRIDEQLKSIRTDSKKTQRELASSLNIHPVTYNGWELGKSEPNIAALCKLADYYHITLDYLVGRQFASDAGYLTDPEKQLLAMFRSMTENNKKTLLSEASSFLLIQNSK